MMVPVIPNMWKMKAGGSWFQANPSKNTRPYLKKNEK
jgi:hypothetical protein